MAHRLHTLLISSSADDHPLVQSMLQAAFGNNFRLSWTECHRQAMNIVESHGGCDVILLDHKPDDDENLELLYNVVMHVKRPTPVILLTSTEDRQCDLEATRLGASDYLFKQELSPPLLERSIRYAIERKRIEQRLITLSHFDPLTGLANRTLFYIKLQDGIHQALRANHSLALLFLDLDHFKEVNDTLGHPVGDSLLQQVSERLSQVIRQADTVARLGGDEFAIVATRILCDNDTNRLAKKIIAVFDRPFIIDGCRISTHTSIGIALFPNHGRDPDELLKHADLALYQAKEAGRSTYRYYDPELDARAQEHKALEQEMRFSLSEGNFVLHFQPMLCAETRQLIGAEALVRWAHPVRGMIPPDQFIPLAESNGLIVPLGKQVLQMACRQAKLWQEAGLPLISIAVNLSPVQFHDEQLVATVAEAIESSGIDPGLLELEITENTLMEDGVDVVELLEQLHSLGLKLAIDDFGTGYSSLAYLKRFPVHKLKIDRTFIKDIESDADDAIITRSIINLGRSMNLDTIAEGVETEAQLAFLQREGCQQVQGFMFGKPMPTEKFVSWYQQRVGMDLMSGG